MMENSLPEVDPTANDLMNIDTEVCESNAVSDADFIEGIKGQRNESGDDGSDNEQQTKMLKKPDFKGVMNVNSITASFRNSELIRGNTLPKQVIFLV